MRGARFRICVAACILSLLHLTNVHEEHETMACLDTKKRKVSDAQVIEYVVIKKGVYTNEMLQRANQMYECVKCWCEFGIGEHLDLVHDRDDVFRLILLIMTSGMSKEDEQAARNCAKRYFTLAGLHQYTKIIENDEHR